MFLLTFLFEKTKFCDLFRLEDKTISKRVTSRKRETQVSVNVTIILNNNIFKKQKVPEFPWGIVRVLQPAKS